MKPVYQTIVDIKKGNCLAACWASVLEVDLTAVPNFAENEDMDSAAHAFAEQNDYGYYCYVVNENRTDIPQETKLQYQLFNQGQLDKAPSINGYYHGVVFSPSFFDKEKFLSDPDYIPIAHAVVIDKDYNIVHDPNPRYKDLEKYPMADEWGYNGIIGVELFMKKARD